MWNDGRSILLSRISVIVFMLLLALTAIFAPWLVHRMFIYTGRSGTEANFLVTIYTGCIPAAVLLAKLFCVLRRIERSEVFVQKNVESLRHISWCCIVGAGICTVSVLYYVPWVTVAVAAAFMGLIVRVVKNVVARAVSLQDDADFTI